MKEMFKLGFILAAYAVVSCVGLAFVYKATAPAIEAAKAQAINDSLKDIFPEATDFPLVTDGNFSTTQVVKIQNAYMAVKNGVTLGSIIQATGPTYATATILVGVDMNRVIKSIKFVELTDTPGIGSVAGEPKFYNQFAQKSIDDSFTVGADVDRIGGATITSKGVANIVKFAAYTAGQYLSEKYGAIAGSGEAPVLSAQADVVSYEDAIKILYPDAQRETLAQAIPNTIDKSIVFTKTELVKKNDSVIGIVITARGPTYKSGTVVVGVNTDRTIAGMRIIELKDTKNIGTQVLEPEFLNQFTGLNVDESIIFQKNDNLDAVSGATVSSSGVANMVKIVGYAGADYLAKEYGGIPSPDNSQTFDLNVVDPEM